jgi:hypothetical protein
VRELPLDWHPGSDGDQGAAELWEWWCELGFYVLLGFVCGAGSALLLAALIR